METRGHFQIIRLLVLLLRLCRCCQCCRWRWWRQDRPFWCIPCGPPRGRLYVVVAIGVSIMVGGPSRGRSWCDRGGWGCGGCGGWSYEVEMVSKRKLWLPERKTGFVLTVSLLLGPLVLVLLLVAELLLQELDKLLYYHGRHDIGCTVAVWEGCWKWWSRKWQRMRYLLVKERGWWGIMVKANKGEGKRAHGRITDVQCFWSLPPF